MINLYTDNIKGYKKNSVLNPFGGYESTITDEQRFVCYIEDINDADKYGIFGIDQFYELKLVVTKGMINNYKAIEYIEIDSEEYRVIKRNYYKLGSKQHLEFVIGLEVKSNETG